MDIAAAALQCASIAFQAFHGCILAIEFFETAQHIGADGDLLHSGLQLEKYRLISWAERVGLLEDQQHQTVNWQLAGILLKQLESMLTSAEKLRGRYALEVTEEEVEAIEEARAAEKPKKGVAQLIAKLKPNIHTTTGQIIQENNNAIKRIRWASRDREKLRTFLAEIAGLNTKLEFLLDSAERKQEKEEYGRMLRDVLSLTTNAAEAGEVEQLLQVSGRSDKSINAAAYLKQVRLVLGADKREDEVVGVQKALAGATGPKMPRLAKLGRTLKPWNDAPLFAKRLEFATYRDKQVLIQWKVVEAPLWDRYTDQMKCLAVFLMSLTDRSFRSLPCMGYYQLEDQHRHGIVYSLPDDTTDWEFTTLRELMKRQWYLSLSRRIEIARCLAETVLQLHTAGWLHKSLRSENIIFLAPRGSDDATILASEPFIFGYDYARSDTEESAKAFTHVGDTDVEADLYRHPQGRGLDRETFQKRFDMYGLGCILTELVMWESLVDIFSRNLNEGLKDTIAIANESNESVELPSLEDLLANKEVVAQVLHKAGDSFLAIIRLCSSAVKAKDGEEASLATETAVLDNLSGYRLHDN